MSLATGRSVAWRDGDLIVLSVTALVGAGMIATAWFGASGTARLPAQAAWLNLAVGGFGLFAAGCCVWLVRLRRAVGERRIALIALDPAEEPVETPARRAPVTDSLRLVRAEGMAHVHYPDCALVAGKTVVEVTLADGEPCGMCVS